MDNQCLPCRWIVVKAGVLLALLTGILWVCSDLQTAANDSSQRTELLQRIFLVNVLQRLEER